jgi:putative tricarboxylic transport membrane protein
MINRTDIGVGVIMLITCALLYYFTSTFEEVSPLFAQDVPPERFPRMLLWVIVVLSLALPFERWLRKEKGRLLDKARSRPIQPIVFVTSGFLVIAVFAIQWIGTFLVLVAVCIGLPLLWGERRWKFLLPFVVLFPAAIMLLFSGLLSVYFEPGAIGFSLF